MDVRSANSSLTASMSNHFPSIVSALARQDWFDVAKKTRSAMSMANDFGCQAQFRDLIIAALAGNEAAFHQTKRDIQAQAQRRLAPEMGAFITEEIATSASACATRGLFLTHQAQYDNHDYAGAAGSLTKMMHAAMMSPVHKYVPFDHMFNKVMRAGQVQLRHLSTAALGETRPQPLAATLSLQWEPVETPPVGAKYVRQEGFGHVMFVNSSVRRPYTENTFEAASEQTRRAHLGRFLEQTRNLGPSVHAFATANMQRIFERSKGSRFSYAETAFDMWFEETLADDPMKASREAAETASNMWFGETPADNLTKASRESKMMRNKYYELRAKNSQKSTAYGRTKMRQFLEQIQDLKSPVREYASANVRRISERAIARKSHYVVIAHRMWAEETPGGRSRQKLRAAKMMCEEYFARHPKEATSRTTVSSP